LVQSGGDRDRGADVNLRPHHPPRIMMMMVFLILMASNCFTDPNNLTSHPLKDSREKREIRSSTHESTEMAETERTTEGREGGRI